MTAREITLTLKEWGYKKNQSILDNLRGKSLQEEEEKPECPLWICTEIQQKKKRVWPK